MLVVLIGCATAGLGAWVTVLSPNAVGGPMLITLGTTVATSSVAHARGERRAQQKKGEPHVGSDRS